MTKKIKKTIKVGLLVLSVLSWQMLPIVPAALALGIPFPVQGQVTLDGAAADGATVVLTDANTGATLSDTVGATGASATSGWYSFDLGNLSIAATNGDTINIVATINGLSGSASFVYNSASGSAIPATIAIVTPTLTTITVTPSPVSVAVGSTQQFTASALDQFGAALNPQPAITWASADTAIATINASGLVTGVAAGGPINITATSGAVSGTASLTVTAAPVLTSVSVSPASASIFIGATQQLTVSPLDQNSVAFVGATITWSSSNTAAATVDTNGLVTGAGTGTSIITVTATSGAISVSATSMITVAAAPVITSISLTPATASIVLGTTQQFTASALDQFGVALNPQPTFTWASSNAAVATIDANGLATSAALGTTTITATSGAVSATASLTITAVPVLTTISITPAAPSIIVGNTQQLSASGLDQFGAALNPQPTFTWASSNTAVATVDPSGLVTALSTGTTTITVASGAISNTSLITVTAAPVLTSISVVPASASIILGATQQFTATALDQFGAALNPQPTFTWASSSTTLATIDINGLATALGSGTINITATSGVVSGSASLSIVAPILTSISITPATSSIIVGATQQFTASALDQFGTALNPQPTFTWGSGSPAVAGIDATGLATALTVGSSTIVVTSGTVSGTAQLTVVPVPVLTTISLTPTSTSIILGATQQFTATALDQFGAALNPQPTFTWASSNAVAATIDVSGLATGAAVGTTTITATSGAVSATASLSVTPVPVLTSIIIIPPASSIAIGVTKQLTATALDQFGAALNPQPTFTWGTSSTTIASVSASGLVTALAAGGPVTITATSGTISGTATINVLNSTLSSIVVQPSAGIVKVGSTLQLRAAGLDQTGAVLVTPPTFTWVSSNTSVASISASGLATGLAVGTSTISASNGAIIGTALITVSTSTRIEIGDDLTEIERDGCLSPEGSDDYATTTALTATHDIHITLHSSEGNYEIELPEGVRISREDGLRIDGTALTATSSPSSSLSGLDSSLSIQGALKWGLADSGLVFSLPITLRIFVGTSRDGQTLQIRRSISGSSGWTSDGIVAPATCLVAGGQCVFQATRASYYAAAAVISGTAPAASSGGGGGGGGPLPTSNAYAEWLNQSSNPTGGQVLGEQAYAEGALLRANGGIDVYIVKYVGAKKFKRLILSPSVFNSYGHLKWEDILNVDQSVLDTFTTSNLVRAAGGIRVYKLTPSGDTGTKQWIETAAAFNNMGFDWDAIYEVNNTDLNTYQTGADLS